MKDIEIITWVKFNKPGLKELVERLAEQSPTKMDFVQKLKGNFGLPLSDANEVANRFYKQ